MVALCNAYLMNTDTPPTFAFICFLSLIFVVIWLFGDPLDYQHITLCHRHTTVWGTGNGVHCVCDSVSHVMHVCDFFCFSSSIQTD